MDMWEPFIQSTLGGVSLASYKIVFDRFHGMQHMAEAVNVLRCRENRLLTAEDDDRRKGTKYPWMPSKEKVHPKLRAEFRVLRGSDLTTARAWAIKENLRHMWSCLVECCARRFVSQWRG
jgi:transposase